MSKYFNKDCFDVLPSIPDNSVDLIFCDLPYNSTNCKWDCALPLDKLWEEFKRIRKDTTPIVMTCTTRFGYKLLESNPKEFRFDLVWQKSRKCGFLHARKRPLCNHEMVYFFYKKQPTYNYLKYHIYTKKTKTDKKRKVGGVYGHQIADDAGTYKPTLPASVITDNTAYTNNTGQMRTINKNGTRPFVPITGVGYDPPLPVSVIKGGNLYSERDLVRVNTGVVYDPPLPASVLYDKTLDETNRNENGIYGDTLLKDRNVGYDPPLPVSVISGVYPDSANHYKGDPTPKIGGPNYDPPLPGSVVNTKGGDIYGPLKSRIEGGYEPTLPASVIGMNEGDHGIYKRLINKDGSSQFQQIDPLVYDPPLPVSIQPFKSTKPNKHQTGKPVDLMEFILKYWSNEGDTVFDPTFGGGSMPIACKKLNRTFIGCEMDAKFYQSALDCLDKTDVGGTGDV